MDLPRRPDRGLDAGRRENLAAAPIERILQRLPAVNRVAVYAVPDEHVGDQVMAALVLQDEATLTPAELQEFLAAQPDLSVKAWPRFVQVAPDLPSTATNKVLKRELRRPGPDRGQRRAVDQGRPRDGVLERRRRARLTVCAGRSPGTGAAWVEVFRVWSSPRCC